MLEIWVDLGPLGPLATSMGGLGHHNESLPITYLFNTLVIFSLHLVKIKK